MSEGPTIAAKLAKVMGAVGHVEKKGRNEFQRYDYVRETDIVDAVSKHLAEESVAIIPKVVNMSFEPITTKQGTPGYFAVVTMSYTFVCGDTGESLTVEAVGAGTDQPGDKAFYKAATGAKKYALTQTFLIATGDDPEDERAEKPARKKAQQTPQNSPRQEQQSEPAPQGEPSEKAKLIPLRKRIRELYPDDQSVKDNTIIDMTYEALAKHYPKAVE